MPVNRPPPMPRGPDGGAPAPAAPVASPEPPAPDASRAAVAPPDAPPAGFLPVPVGDALAPGFALAAPVPPERKPFDAWRGAKKTRRSLWEAARVLGALAVDEPLTEADYDAAIERAGRNEVT